MRFAICNEIFRGWSLEDTVAYVAKAGYAAIELAPFTLADSVNAIGPERRTEIRNLAAQYSLEIAGLHWLLVKPEGLHMTHPDAKIRQRTSKYFCDLVDFCGDLEGKIMVVGSPKQRSLEPGVSPEQGWRWALDTFSPAVARAQERGVTLCLEPLAPAETNFINTAADAIRFTRELNSPNFKIILDVKAMCSEDKPIPDIIAESWPHFVHFHANDRNLKGPGFGEVDFKPIAFALNKVGYSGYVSVEVFDFDKGPEIIATRSFQYLKEVFG